MADYIYKIPDPEDLIPCPYEKAHMVRAKRFQYHLMKCRKNYVGKEFATCPFNARHEMPKPELRYHLSQCPDRAMLEPDYAFEAQKQSNDGSYFKGCTDVPAYEQFDVKSSENWDEDIPTYARIGIDPSFYESRGVFRDTSGMKPSEKKEYYRNHALTPEERQNQYKEEEEEKLRLPHNKPQTYLGYKPEIPVAQQPPTVFAYSLSMAGIGRGQAGGRGTPPTSGTGMVQGRGMGRGALRANKLGSLQQATTAPVNGGDEAYQQPQMNGTTPPNTVFTMGIGRGRGGMLQNSATTNGVDNPAFVVPTIRRPVSASIAASVANRDIESDSDKDGRSNTDSPSDDTDSQSINVCSDVENAKNRTRKKLNKKLKQIEILEEKMKTTLLTEDEKSKLSKKEDILHELQAL